MNSEFSKFFLLEVLNALNLLSITDLSHFTVEKFHQSNNKNYKELLLILEDLVKLVDYKFKQNDSLIFDNTILPSCSSPRKRVEEQDTGYNKSQINDQKLNILNNLSFIREFHQSIQPYQTIVPNDVNLFLKANNLQQIGSNGESAEARIANLRKKISDLEISNLDTTTASTNHILRTENEKSIINKELINELKSGLDIADSSIQKFNNLIDVLHIPNEKNKSYSEMINIEEIYNLNKNFQHVTYSINIYFLMRSITILF